jgi:hypothetical protein
MLSLSQVEDQLKQVGCNFRFWGRPEIRELCNILIPGERIAQAVNGRYENGGALLCVTDHRLLLIDKKPMFLTLEDVRFDMIAEIDFNWQLFEGTVQIITPNRTMVFKSWSQDRLRKVLNYTQQRISELRQHSMQQQFQQVQLDTGSAGDFVGNLAMQGNTEYATTRNMPFNPYLKTPLTMRKRRIPKFY